MTVGELIEVLQDKPRDAKVVTYDATGAVYRPVTEVFYTRFSRLRCCGGFDPCANSDDSEQCVWLDYDA